jgi:DNA-binding NtrC family response regulator
LNRELSRIRRIFPHRRSRVSGTFRGEFTKKAANRAGMGVACCPGKPLTAMSTTRGEEAAATLIGHGPRMHAVREFIRMNAADMTPLIVTGEEGTGRRFVGRLLHEWSPRRPERLALVRASGLTPARLEAYLRDSGTVLLEALDEMSLGAIDALLRRLNGEAGRLIATAEMRLALRSTDFRIVLPALRERPEDIASLTDLFLARITGGQAKPISPAAREALQHYDWPGNLRDLQQTCEWIARTCTCAVVRRGCLPARLQLSEVPAPPVHETANERGLDPQLRHFEAELIVRALMETGYNRSRAARLLNIKRSTLGDRIRRLGIAEHVQEVA